jgi:translation initiation factor 3 subunit G
VNENLSRFASHGAHADIAFFFFFFFFCSLQCENLPPGIEPGITSLGDEVMIIAKTKTTTPVEAKKDEVFTVNIVCRTCGKEGDHWTSKCPYKGRLQDLPDAPRQDEPDTPTRALRSGGGYVPPAMRAGGNRAGESDRGERNYRDYDDANTIRVSNLSEEATQADVEDMFMPFGRTTRVFLARDKKTNLSRGFAFISYIRREDAQRAIDKMNGHGYLHLILKVEFSEKK